MSLRPLLFLIGCTLLAPAAQATQFDNWLEVVRQSPYWVSQGSYDNILTIRQWVLGGRAYCEQSARHILYDRRGRFLGYIDNESDNAATQQKLNATRAHYAQIGRSDIWVAGSTDTLGYPFALSCDQPHVDLNAAIRRYLGKEREDRLWGSWDDLVIGSPNELHSLHTALHSIYSIRQTQQRISLPTEMPRYLAAKLLIESGARTHAHSLANARGIMQLSPAVLNDCGIEEHNHWHRMAQFDCALRLLSQNARDLRSSFDQRFGHLPEAKHDRLFTLLLIQAYHGGAGRVKALLNDPELAKPAAYFAQNHARFSAGDIAFGMIFHNLGRNRLGLASLYYIVDVELAALTLCARPELHDSGFCPGATDDETEPMAHLETPAPMHEH